MGTHQTLTGLRVAQRARFAAVIRDFNKIHAIMAHDGQDDFQESTKGNISSKTLAAMGHPFGRLGGQGSNSGGRGIKGDGRRFGKLVTAKGVVRPLPINRQSGRLHAGIQLVGPIGRRKEYRLYSTAPYARFVLNPGGTRKMVARGLLGPTGLLRKRHKARLAALVDVVRATGRKP